MPHDMLPNQPVPFMVPQTIPVACVHVKIENLTPHPKNFEIYGEEDILQLAERINESGWIKPLVVTYACRIISGHRRFRAAQLLGYEKVPVEMRHFDTYQDELEALLLENETRHKTVEQKVREAAVWHEIEAEKARKRQAAGANQTNGTLGRLMDETVKANLPEASKGQTRDVVAEKIGMKPRTYEKALAVVRQIDQHAAEGDQRLANVLRTVLNGQSVDAASQLTKLDEDEQKEVAQLVESQPDHRVPIKQTIQAMRRQRTAGANVASPRDISVTAEDHYRLIVGDIFSSWRELGIEPESVDVIITEPSCSPEYLSKYEALAKLAKEVLRPGGSLLAICGQSDLPEILAFMIPHIKYHWTLAYLTPGGQDVPLWQKRVHTFWKPVLWFVKGNYSGDWPGDVISCAENDKDKHLDEWGPSEVGIAKLVEKFSSPGQTILDPFVGIGTTGVVAVKMDRRFIGIDIDLEAIETTRAKLNTEE